MKFKVTNISDIGNVEAIYGTVEEVRKKVNKDLDSFERHLNDEIKDFFDPSLIKIESVDEEVRTGIQVTNINTNRVNIEELGESIADMFYKKGRNVIVQEIGDRDG